MPADPAALKALPARLSKPTRDGRTAEEFRRALERETDASLRHDSSRWPWRRSDRVRDTHRGRAQGARWW